nr:hypothetical protein [Tanacetum cinerariifolium]
MIHPRAPIYTHAPTLSRLMFSPLRNFLYNAVISILKACNDILPSQIPVVAAAPIIAILHHRSTRSITPPQPTPKPKPKPPPSRHLHHATTTLSPPSWLSRHATADTTTLSSSPSSEHHLATVSISSPSSPSSSTSPRHHHLHPTTAAVTSTAAAVDHQPL